MRINYGCIFAFVLYTMAFLCFPVGSSVDNDDKIYTGLIEFEDNYSVNVIDVFGYEGNMVKTMYNNPDASNVTYGELCDFLEKDETDSYVYIYDEFDCMDFATVVHNNAEKEGIRCGLAGIFYENDSIGHCINVFNTTDKGIVFVDCTGSMDIHNEKSFDTVVNLTVGELYNAVSIHGHKIYEEPVHVIERYWICW